MGSTRKSTKPHTVSARKFADLRLCGLQPLGACSALATGSSLHASMRLPQLPTASSAAATLLAGLLASSSVLPCQLPPPASAAALDASTVQLALRYSELETRDPEQSFTSRLPQIEWGNVAAQFTDTAAKAESAAESAAAKAAEDELAMKASKVGRFGKRDQSVGQVGCRRDRAASGRTC